VATKDKLTDTAIRARRAPTKPVKLFDGGGLYLLLRPDGRRYWRLKYRIDGVEKLISLGVYPEVSLTVAREKREEAKRLLAGELDPSANRKAEKAKRLTAAQNTFEAVARE
jgi:hypothetical protein